MQQDAIEFQVRGVVVGVFKENCWIIGSRGRGEAVVVDPGDEPEEILALARDMGVRITRIVASHAHLDHIMAVRTIKEVTGADFLLHKADRSLADALPRTTEQLLGYAVPPAPQPDRYLTGGESLEIAGLDAQILHTPGHTPGSVCLYVPDAGLLFSGDTLFRGSIGRTDLPGGNHMQIIRSIVDQLMLLPDETRVLPGHMLETRIGQERSTNPFLQATLHHQAGAV